MICSRHTSLYSQKEQREFSLIASECSCHNSPITCGRMCFCNTISFSSSYFLFSIKLDSLHFLKDQPIGFIAFNRRKFIHNFTTKQILSEKFRHQPVFFQYKSHFSPYWPFSSAKKNNLQSHKLVVLSHKGMYT